eukprot:354169-Chlamydomonas_euryale.AAC.7
MLRSWPVHQVSAPPPLPCTLSVESFFKRLKTEAPCLYTRNRLLWGQFSCHLPAQLAPALVGDNTDAAPSSPPPSLLLQVASYLRALGTEDSGVVVHVIGLVKPGQDVVAEDLLQLWKLQQLRFRHRPAAAQHAQQRLKRLVCWGQHLRRCGGRGIERSRSVFVCARGSTQAGRQESRESGNQGDRKAGKQAIRETGNQGSRQSGGQETREAGNQGDRKPGKQGGLQG